MELIGQLKKGLTESNQESLLVIANKLEKTLITIPSDADTNDADNEALYKIGDFDVIMDQVMIESKMDDISNYSKQIQKRIREPV